MLQKSAILNFCIVIFALSNLVEGFSAKSPSTKTFHFGGGCFWAPADNLRNVPGVLSTKVGYCGDDTPFPKPPTYERVCNGRTKLVEAVRVEYDENQLSYSDMLSLFADVNTAQWENKRQYRGIIFTASNEEKKIAKKFLEENQGVVAELEPMSETFYTAEKYHQDYWAKWRVRIPSFVATLVLFGVYGGDFLADDIAQKVYNVIVYGFILFTMLERRIFTDVETVIVGKSE